MKKNLIKVKKRLLNEISKLLEEKDENSISMFNIVRKKLIFNFQAIFNKRLRIIRVLMKKTPKSKMFKNIFFLIIFFKELE